VFKHTLALFELNWLYSHKFQWLKMINWSDRGREEVTRHSALLL